MSEQAIPNAVSTRRDFLRSGALASGAVAAASTAAGVNIVDAAAASSQRPNVLMICADQFRADFVYANQENPSANTPHIDALAQRGVNFTQCMANQPLCSPSRASFMTSRYATQTGVWKLGPELDHSLPTIATEFRKNGYSANFIGKWHVSQTELANGQKQLGWIPPGPSRAGFDDLWEGANVLEVVSHPYHGNYWDDSGTNIGFKDEYRVDFITNRGVNFIEQKHDKPWFLFLSQLEPHQQNDIDEFVPPKRYADKYSDPYIPADLRNLPGNWRSRIPGYYG
ncbi:MAG TPA: sulfatase-like hydrolase/transferase, partial [Edaphobacter sp.]|nr:sulfatase-like hydrolase/transferase [Edaphobacter sp.]